MWLLTYALLFCFIPQTSRDPIKYRIKNKVNSEFQGRHCLLLLFCCWFFRLKNILFLCTLKKWFENFCSHFIVKWFRIIYMFMFAVMKSIKIGVEKSQSEKWIRKLAEKKVSRVIQFWGPNAYNERDNDKMTTMNFLASFLFPQINFSLMSQVARFKWSWRNEEEQ